MILMGSTTSILGLYKPAAGETGWSASVNANFDAIDALAAVVPTVSRSVTAYTLAFADLGKIVEFTSSTAVTVTIPANAAVAFPIGALIGILQYGAGQVRLTPTTGVTLRSSGARLKTATQYSAIWLHKRAVDEWVVTGDTA